MLWSQFFTGPHGERLAEICDAAGKAGVVARLGRHLQFSHEFSNGATDFFDPPTIFFSFLRDFQGVFLSVF